MDSDEDLLEKILKLPLQADRNKQLFSIAEVTEEEDNSLELEASLHGGARFGGGPMASSSSLSGRYYGPKDLLTGKRPRPHVGLSGGSATPMRSKRKHRVHYADTVETINYLEECDLDSSVYIPDKDVRVRVSQEKGHRSYPLRDAANRNGDQLRREALLRSQITSDLVASGQHHRTALRAEAPAGTGAEIDIEYGTEDDEEAVLHDPGEVVAQMSSGWWVEGGRSEVLEEPSGHFGSFGSIRPKKASGPYSRDKGLPEGQPHDAHRLSLQCANPEHAAKGYSAPDGHARVCFSPLGVREWP